MRIERASLNLASHAERLQSESRDERLLVWVGERPPERSGNASPTGIRPPPFALAEPAPASRELPELAAPESTELDAELQGDHLVERLLLERMFGVRVERASSVQVQEASVSVHVEAGGEAAAAPQTAGWGLEYDRVVERVDAQSFSFRAEGQVVTGDGRTISLDVQLAEARTSYQREELHVRAGDARKVDPLAVTLGTASARLEAAQVAFDLDADGTKESIARLASNAGWLALDRNGNGVVDDGSELFGPTTGDGFAELRALDTDQDGFLDEDDAAFTQLRVANGGFDARLLTLREAGIGAIGVMAAATPMEYGGLGELRETGILLTEAGGVGLVQHVDLVATEPAPPAPES